MISVGMDPVKYKSRVLALLVVSPLYEPLGDTSYFKASSIIQTFILTLRRGNNGTFFVLDI